MCNNPNNNPNDGLHVYYLTTVATNGGKSTKKHSSKVPLSAGKMTFMTGGKRITRTVYKKSTGGSYYKMKNPETHKMEYKRIRSKMRPLNQTTVLYKHKFTDPLIDLKNIWCLFKY